MKYNKEKAADTQTEREEPLVKKLNKNSSWESLQTMKKATKSLVKSNSQISFHQKDHSNSNMGQMEFLKKNASLKEIKMFNLNVNVDIQEKSLKDYNYDKSDDVFASEEFDYKTNWENLKRDYEKKSNEVENLFKKFKKKEIKIKELETNLNEIIKYNSKLVSCLLILRKTSSFQKVTM